MAVTYTSRYHCPEDPGGLIQETLDLGPGFPGPAEDVLLSWSLRLDDDLPAEAAARLLLARIGLAEGPLPPGDCGRLVGLLRQAAMQSETGVKRRRGGSRNRRN